MSKYVVKRIWVVEADDTMDAILAAKPGYHIKTICEEIKREHHA